MSYLTRTSPRRPDRPVSSRTGPIRQPAVSLPRRNAIVALDENGAPDFNDEADLRRRPLSDRKARLQTLLER